MKRKTNDLNSHTLIHKSFLHENMVPKPDPKNKNKSSVQGENQGATDERLASASCESQGAGEASAATAPSASGSAPASASTTHSIDGKTIPGSGRPSVVSTDEGQHQATADGAKRTNTTVDEHLSKR